MEKIKRDIIEEPRSPSLKRGTPMMMYDDFGGLSAMVWMKTDPEHIDGLKVYSVLYRKHVEETGEYLYTIMADDPSDPRGLRNPQGLEVRLEGVVGKADPLKGLYTAQLKISPHRTIEALVVRGTGLVKSW